MTPSTTRKGKKRYRYYVSRPLFKERSEATPNSARLPADQLEAAVLGAFNAFIRDPFVLGKAYDAVGSSLPAGFVPQIAARLGTLTQEQFTALFTTAVTKVLSSSNGVEVTIDLAVLYERAHGTQLPRDPADDAHNLRYVQRVPLVIRQKGQETRIALPGRPEIDTGRQPGLVRAIARGREWWQKLLDGTSLQELCEQSGVSDRYIQRLLPLAFLSPRIVTDIVEGKYPSDLTLDRLLGSLKLDWREQAKAIGQ
jgi:site-specific DNA recombinase